MGLFKWKRKGKKEKEKISKKPDSEGVREGKGAQEEEGKAEFDEESFINSENRPDPYVYQKGEDGKEFILSSCETIYETLRSQDVAKKEYESVTNYLTDIQTINAADQKIQASLENTARQIVSLNQELEKYRGKIGNLTPSQYHKIEKYEEVMPEEIKKMEENELFFTQIKSDLRHLDNEKKQIRKDERTARSMQKYLKKLSITVGVLLVSLIGVFIGLAIAFEVDMTIPYLLAIGLTAVAITYIFLEGRRNKATMELCGRKMNKAITIENKVKIKYINTSNLLDYLYHKFDVENSGQLRYQQGEFFKAKEAERQFKDNNHKLESCQQKLSVTLKKLNLMDCEIWGYQAEALVNPKEMVEIRHRLNVRRQKLRVQIDNQNKLITKVKGEVGRLVEAQPEYKELLAKIMKQYGI